HESLRLDGFQHTYIELPGHGHNHPDMSTFERALAALEAKPARAPTTGPIRGNERPHPDQLAQARRLLTTAVLVYARVSKSSGRSGRSAREARAAPTTARLAQLAADDPMYDTALARRCLIELFANYPTTPAAADAPFVP